MRAVPDPIRAARLERRVLGALVALALLLLLVGIHWGLPNVESWNGDEIAPDKPLRVLHDWLRGANKYPYLHWWLNLVLYLPWLTGVSALGQVDLGCLPRLRTECFAEPWRDMTVFMVISRLLTVAMAVGVVLATRRLALALHRDRVAALFSAAICLASPVFVFFGHTTNLDVPHTFWFTLSLVAAVAVWRRGAPVDYLAFGFLAACALLTKDTILGAYVLTGLALLAVHVARVARERGIRGVALWRRALLDRRLLLLGAVLLGMCVLVQNLLFNFAGFREHVRIWVEGGPALVQLRGRARGHGVGWLPWRLAVSLEGLLGWPMLLLCLAGAVLAAFRERRTWVLGIPMLSYALFSLLPGFIEPRVVLPLLPIFAVFGGVLASRLLRLSGGRRLAAGALLAAVAAHELALGVGIDLQLLHDARYEAEAWLADHVPRGARIAALSGPKFLPRLKRMDYDVRWFAPAEIRPGALEATDLDWVVVSAGSHAWADRAYLDALRAGRLDYELVFHTRGGARPPRWLRTRARPGAVSPEVFVLRRRGEPRRPGTAKR
jgi:hypothetical protein